MGAITTNKLKRVIIKSAKRTLKEVERNGLFDIYTHDTMRGASVFILYEGTLYELPENIFNEYDIYTKDGRNQLLDTITMGDIPTSHIDTFNLKGFGFKCKSFNANAW